MEVLTRVRTPATCPAAANAHSYESDFPFSPQIRSRLFSARGSTVPPWVGVTRTEDSRGEGQGAGLFDGAVIST